MAALLDTGSSVTLVREPLRSADCTMTITTASGARVQAAGRRMTLVVGGVVAVETTVYHVPSLPVEAVVGQDILGRARLDNRRGVLKLDGRTVPTFLRGVAAMALLARGDGTVRVACDDRIPARTERLVEVVWPVEVRGGAAMLEPKGSVSGLQVCRTLHATEAAHTYARVLNSSGVERRLCAGQGIALATMVEEAGAVDAWRAGTTQERRGTDGTAVGAEIERAVEHLPHTQREQLRALLLEFAGVFEGLGRARVTPFRIRVRGEPTREAPRRTSPSRQAIIREELRDLRQKGLIRPSESPFSAPLVLVRKKDGSLRMCVDYRRLNAQTVRDAYPLPRLEELLDQLAGHAWYTTLDLRAGYHQVPVAEEDREKTAFAADGGLWEWCVLPFGLTNAPPAFQRLADVILAGIRGTVALAYLDDFIVFSGDWASHLADVREVLQRMRQIDLRVKLRKCSFAQQQVEFLGHRVSSSGVQIDAGRVRSLSSWPVPQTRQELERFHGVINFFRRFLPGLASAAEPLYRLLKKDAPFEMGDAALAAFHRVRRMIADVRELAHPDTRARWRIDTDAATGVGLGAALLQRDRPVGFYSRTLKPAERNYTAVELETLAVVEALRHWRHFVEGGEVDVYTDNRAVTFIRRLGRGDATGRLARWAIQLSEYNITLYHRRGKDNVLADALSRRGVDTDTGAHTGASGGGGLAAVAVASVQQQLQEAQAADPWVAVERGRLGSRALENEAGLVCRLAHVRGAVRAQVLVPAAWRPRVLAALHDDAGHLGFHRTLAAVKDRFYWPRMTVSVRQYVASCVACQARKDPPGGSPPLVSIPVEGPWVRIQVDWTRLPETARNNSYLFVMVDSFTKWVEAVPSPTNTAAAGARILAECIFARYGPPREILSDRGQEFRADLVRELLDLFKVRRLYTSGYHPQCNGLTERQNRTLAAVLSLFDGLYSVRDWDLFAPYACWAINTTVQASTGYSAYYLMFGRDPVQPIDHLLAPDRGERLFDTQQQYVERVQAAIRRAYELVYNNIATASAAQRRLFERRHRRAGETLRVGQLVMVKRQALQTSKLTAPWTGPYRIASVDGNTVTVWTSPGRESNRLNKKRVKIFIPRPDDLQEALPGGQPRPGAREWAAAGAPGEQPPRLTAGHASTAPRMVPAVASTEAQAAAAPQQEVAPDEYEVQRIVNHRRQPDGQLLFRIRWKNYPPDDDTWEPEANLTGAGSMLDAYKTEHDLE